MANVPLFLPLTLVGAQKTVLGLGATCTMETKIPDGLPDVDLHPTSKCPHVVLGVSSTTAAQAHPDDGVHYLQQVFLVSIARAITMCASTALRSLLRLSPRGVHGMPRCSTNWTSCASRPCFAVQVARAHLVIPFWVTTSFLEI